MKVSRGQFALNHQRIIETAARMFREKGYDGVSVVDLMKGAGLTHGAFYRHFNSKETLLAEACSMALAASSERWLAISTKAPAMAIYKITEDYLSSSLRDRHRNCCPVPALGADVARSGSVAREVLAAASRERIDILSTLMPGQDPVNRRRKAISAYAAMIGAVMLARLAEDPDWSDELKQAVLASFCT
jgi:TetR/AcrR family transcriptional repressor of nem operon